MDSMASDAGIVKAIAYELLQVREDSQRTEYTGIKELAESIRDTGLIQPIVIDTEYFILAGRRRHLAWGMLRDADMCNHCGFFKIGWFQECPVCAKVEKAPKDKWHNVPVSVMDPHDEYHREIIEFTENVQREDLSPSEQSAAVSRVHELYQRIHGKAKRGWGLGWGQKDTAQALGISQSRVNQHLQTARLVKLDPSLAGESTEHAIWAKFKSGRRALFRDELLRRNKDKLATVADDCVYEGSGVDYLRQCSRESVDCIITDVPFGIDIFDTLSMRDTPLGAEWKDGKVPTDELLAELIPQIARALKENTHAFICCAWHQTFTIARLCLLHDLDLELPPWVWDRQFAVPSRQPHRAAGTRHEYVCHIRKGSPEGSNMGDNVKSTRRLDRPRYPTEKPLGYIEHFVDIGSSPGQLIVDPCCGSGTTAVAALRSGRRVVVCDTNPEAIKLTKFRILTEVNPIDDIGAIEGEDD